MIPQKKANPIYNALAVFLLLSGAVLFISGPMIPKAHADSCTGLAGIDSAAIGNTTSSIDHQVKVTLSTTCTGDIILVFCQMYPASAPGGMGINGTALSWSNRLPFGAALSTYHIAVWAYSASILTNAVISCTYTPGPANSPMLVGAIAIQQPLSSISPFDAHAGLPGISVVSGTSTAYSWSTSTAHDVLIGMATTNTGNTLTIGAEMAIAANHQGTGGLGHGSMQVNNENVNALQVSHTVSVSSSSTTILVAFNDAIKLGADALATTYVVTTCTFFQLQCWWYPMLMFGVGVAPFALVGALGKVNARGMTYLMLFGLTMTSLVEVLMGMINVMFPLGLTVLTIVYLVRIRI